MSSQHLPAQARSDSAGLFRVMVFRCMAQPIVVLTFDNGCADSFLNLRALSAEPLDVSPLCRPPHSLPQPHRDGKPASSPAADSIGSSAGTP